MARGVGAGGLKQVEFGEARAERGGKRAFALQPVAQQVMRFAQ